MEYQLHKFANGIRLLHLPNPHSQAAHLAYMLDIGSRDEKPHQKGLAHFWEHMAFKGTQRRKPFHILNRLDSVGGDLNAFTTREKITFQASCLLEHLERALDLLSDITFYSTFPEKEIEKEKGVILEELSMYEDNPSEAIIDDFESLLFGDHPLGWNILGTRQSIKSFGKQDFQQFLEENLDTHRMVVAVAADMPHEKLVRKAEKHLNPIPARKPERPIRSHPVPQPRREVVEKPIVQSHCLMGRSTIAYGDPRFYGMVLLNNLLGGPGMNSRLNLAVREKKGFVYAIDTQYSSLVDVGVFSIYFATEPRQVSKAQNAVWRELRRISEAPLGKVQLQQARQQLKGQLALARERPANLMIGAARSLLDRDQIIPLSAIFEKLEALSAEDLRALAADVFQASTFSELVFQGNQ